MMPYADLVRGLPATAIGTASHFTHAIRAPARFLSRNLTRISSSPEFR